MNSLQYLIGLLSNIFTWIVLIITGALFWDSLAALPMFERIVLLVTIGVVLAICVKVVAWLLSKMPE